MTVRTGTPDTTGTDAPPERLRAALSGRYIIEREVGRGAMAAVYLARDLKHDRQVAIKVLADDLATTIGATRFLREIQVAAQLLHPNILGLIDSGEAEGLLYYIMPYVRGETLRDKLDREKRLSVNESIRIASEVASALAHAHEYGVIHRDIKPENILLVNGHHAAVADFGLARAVFNASTVDRTSTGLVVGSPYYMSPEQATGEREIDGRTDIYSLGCVLFEMLTGGPPFHGKTVQSVLTQQLTAAVPRVRARRADLSVPLDELVRRALAKDPEQRFQSAQEFSSALAQVSAGSAHPRATGAWEWVLARRRIFIPIAIAAIIAGAVIAFREQVTVRVREVIGPQPEPARYAVVPFRRSAGVPDSVHVEQLLHDGLHRWRGVDVIDQFQMEARIPDPTGTPSQTTAKSAALHFRAGHFVWGDITRYGDSLRVNAVLYDTRTGTALHDATVRIAVVDPNASEVLAKLAYVLLFRGAPATGRTAIEPGTTSYPAQQAYLAGHNALQHWNLVAADSAFSAAVAEDANYASAQLWLGYVRGWLSDNPADWLSIAQRALAGWENLPEREQQLARALVMLASGEMPQACEIYNRLRVEYPTDFVPTYGVGECNRRDKVVIANPASESGWSFRSSWHQAAQAYQAAFELIPGLHRAFQDKAFERVRSLIFTAANVRRAGHALPPDTTMFQAAPSLKGDTLAFVPFPFEEVNARPAILLSATTVAAVDRQRALFLNIARTWRSAYPKSAGTLEAMAIAVELMGDSTAIDTLRAARAIAETEDQRIRLMASEVLVRIKFATPDNPAGLIAARVLADSLLNRNLLPHAEDADLIASIAALTGRAHLAANLARRGVTSARDVTTRAAATSRALLAYSAMGGPLDSIRALERRFSADVRNTVEKGRQTDALRWLVQSPQLAFFQYPFPSMPQLIGKRNNLLDAQYAYAQREIGKAREILEGETRRRASRRPSDLMLDVTYPLSLLSLEIHGVDSALARIDPVLNAAHQYPPEQLTRLANAGAFMRALLLRAELARRAGDAAEAARWERPVDILWANADPGLKEAIKASHRRLAPATAAR